MIVKWLVPPCPPCTRNIEMQTDREVVPELQEASAGPSTAECIGVVISRVFLIITLERSVVSPAWRRRVGSQIYWIRMQMD